MAQAEDETESRVIGRYLLCGAIASGGMATVHLGRLVGLAGFSRTVAIKRLHPHFARDPEFVAMFLDEARLAARIRHPNVVSTLDVVVLRGELFVVMDYVHGEALSRLVRASGPLPPAIAASVISGVLYGLHAAHEARNDDGTPLHIVHRDVSPQNVLVGVDGIARVVDFGVAKAVGRLQTTREGALKGKISYMSPEQVSSDAVDRRTDVYAASVVLWEMLAGRRLFSGDAEVRVLQQVMQGPADPPSRYAPVPRELDALVMKGLSRRPEDRYATAYEMAEAIQRIAFATPGQVSEWVQKTCGQVIEQRARKVAEVESSPAVAIQATAADGDGDGDDDETIARDAPPLGAPVVAAIVRSSISDALTTPALVDSQVSGLNVSSSSGKLPPWYSRFSVGMIAVSTVAFAIGGTIAFIIAYPTGPSSAASSASAASSIDARPPVVVRSAELVETTPPVIATMSAYALPTTTAKPPAAHPTTVRPPRSNCDPPYTMKDGIRMPKMECL
jgi:serine/threonine protein kinase